MHICRAFSDTNEQRIEEHDDIVLTEDVIRTVCERRDSQDGSVKSESVEHPLIFRRFARAEEQAGIVVSEREEHSMIPCMCQSCERRDLKSYVALSRVKSEREEFVVIVDGVKSRFEEHASFHVPRW